jgi:hypothetical protein
MRLTARKLAGILLIMLLGLSVASCTPVQAWERGYLAKREMAWEPDGLESALDKHVFFSKEASSGGNSAAGGGCGCN